MACQFCGENKEIHPDSAQQYGEPVCTDCFTQSFTGLDPTNDEQYANSPDDLYSGLYGQGASRSEAFHTSHMLHRGYTSEQHANDEAERAHEAEDWRY